MSFLQDGWSAAEVVVEKVDVSPWEGRQKFCIVLHNVLSEQECNNLIDFSEQSKYEPALINVGGGHQKLVTGVRNNDRFIYDDPVAMEQMWQRVLASLAEKDPESLDTLLNIPFTNDRLRKGNVGKTFHAVGLNERMRFLRYDPGTFFAPHYDGAYVRRQEAGPEREGEQSFVTFQLYLNDGFKGGATRFLSINDFEDHDEAEGSTPSIWPSILWARKKPANNKPHYNVVPRAGSVLLFQHDCCHEGARLLEGRKYAIRSDVMYSTAGPGAEYAQRPIILAPQCTATSD